MTGYTCGGCGVSLVGAASGASPRPPCSACGSQLRNAWMKAEAMAFKLTLSGSITARLSAATATRDWRRRWAQIQTVAAGLLGPFDEPMSGDAIHARCHALHAFYIQSYHLKDALISDLPNGLNKASIEGAITSTPDLALLADLCNLDKHVNVTSKPRSGTWPTFASLSGKGVSQGNGWHLHLEIVHGAKLLDGVEVATRAVAAWRSVLGGFGLT